MAKKVQQISRVSDLPLLNKIWNGAKTVVAYGKENFSIDISNIKGRKIIGMTSVDSEESGGKNVIYINFDSGEQGKIYTFNGSEGDKGDKGGTGSTGKQGETGYINTSRAGITGTIHIVNNSVTDNPELPWSAYRGKDMNDKIYDMNEIFMTEDEFNLLFNDIKYLYAEFKTKIDNKDSYIFNNDTNSHVVYKKYWTYEDEGGVTYYIVNPVTGEYEAITADLWSDIYLGSKEGYFPATSSMNTDSNDLYYFDNYTNEYKLIDKVYSSREVDGSTVSVYLGDKKIDDYYIPEIDAHVSAKYAVANDRWSFELHSNSIYVPDVYVTEYVTKYVEVNNKSEINPSSYSLYYKKDGNTYSPITSEDEFNSLSVIYDTVSEEVYTKMKKSDVLAIDTTQFAQYYQLNTKGEYEQILNIGAYLSPKSVRYYKRNYFEEEDGVYVKALNNQYCEVPESEIDYDSLEDDFIIFTYNRTNNDYTFERHYPGKLYGEDIQNIDTVTISNIDLYYYTSDRKYYSSVLVPGENDTLVQTYVEVEIPSWIYAEFKSTEEDQVSLLLSTNVDTTGEKENNEVIDNTIEDLDDSVEVDKIFRIVPGIKKDLYIKTADNRYVLVNLSKDSIYSTSEYYILDDENKYLKVENPEEYLSTYDFVIFNGEPKILPITIYPSTNRSYVTIEYDPRKIIFFEDGRIAATIGNNFETVITVSSENSDAKAYINVRVTTPVKSIELDENNNYSIDVGYNGNIKYSVIPEVADNHEINWTYDDEYVSITPVSDGEIKVEGLKAGNIKILAEAADGFGAKREFNFEIVEPATGLSWGDDELIVYHPETYYTPEDAIAYNAEHGLGPDDEGAKKTGDLKDNAYYSMVVLLGKDYVLNTVVTPKGTSYPEIVWTTSNPSVANVSSRNAKVVDKEAVKRIITQEDVDNNLKDVSGNVVTADMIGEEITLEREISHTELEYVLSSSRVGNVTISGSLERYPQFNISIEVRVDQSIEEIVVTPDVISMNVNTKKKLSAEILPDTAVNGTISWHSSNSDIVEVSATGLITAKGIGNTTIIAHAEDGSETEGVCNVTVTIPAKDIYINADNINGIIYLGIGKTTKVNADVVYDSHYSGNNKLGINWTSSDENVATIDESGEVTGISLGKSTIIANAKDGSGVFGSIQIQVIKLVESVKFDFEEIEMEVGDSLVLIPKFEPIDASNEIVIWKSSDESIAKVKESGIVYALSTGSATVTATTTDGTDLEATCQINIS